VPQISLECVSAEMYEMWALRAEPEERHVYRRLQNFRRNCIHVL